MLVTPSNLTPVATSSSALPLAKTNPTILTSTGGFKAYGIGDAAWNDQVVGGGGRVEEPVREAGELRVKRRGLELSFLHRGKILGIGGYSRDILLIKIR